MTGCLALLLRFFGSMTSACRSVPSPLGMYASVQVASLGAGAAVAMGLTAMPVSTAPAATRLRMRRFMTGSSTYGGELLLPRRVPQVDAPVAEAPLLEQAQVQAQPRRQ